MQAINVEENNTKTHALLIPKNELIRLKKILTKKDDDRAAVEMSKRLRDERLARSKAIAKTWDTTVLNQRKKEIENRQKLVAMIEAKQLKRDAILKLEILERRNKIIEMARLKKWSERDSTKALTRAVHKIEVLNERSMQIEFNKVERAKELAADRLLKIGQNLDAERYKKDRWEQKLKQAETKKANMAFLLNELKKREDIKRKKDLKIREESKAELIRIATKIEEDKKKEKDKAQERIKNLLIHLSQNKKIVAKNIKLRQLEDEEENAVVSIMAIAKKKIARTRKLKEIEILKGKQTLLEKMVEAVNTNQDKQEVAFQNAIKEKEWKYQKEELEKKELIEKRKKNFEDSKKFWDEKNTKEKDRLTLSHQWEVERRLRETEMLNKLENSRRQAKTRETNNFRKNLDLQRDNNRAATIANERVDLEQYNAQLKMWQQQDEEFMTYTKNMMDKYTKLGISVIPLIKAIEEYQKNNKLLVNAIDDKNSELNSQENSCIM